MLGTLNINDLNTLRINGNDVSKGFTSLLVEHIVTSVAETSIDFSGLDISIHKSYHIEIEILNATASTGFVNCFVNNDTVVTNYYSQVSGGSGGSPIAAGYNAPYVMRYIAGSMPQCGKMSMHIVSGNVMYNSETTIKASASSMYVETFGGFKVATVTNITQLTFTSSVVGALGVGSKIRIYRGDL